jgi:murein DD-endopeptidase MepM/ murein hydrolase activator NlpD
MRQSLAKLITILLCLVFAYGLVLYVTLREPSADESISESIVQTTPTLDEAEASEEGPYDETLTINAGDTLASILNRIGIPNSQAHEAIAALSKVFNPKDLKVDQEVYVIYDSQPDGEGYDLKFLRIRADLDHDVELVRTGGGLFQATKYKKELKHEYVAVEGDIKISLYADALKAGASPKMLYDMIKAFSYDIDFQRDIQPGTTFSLFYDTYKDEESGLERPGELLAAKLTIEGKSYEIYRFQPPGGVPGYYTTLGEATRKALMRTPIDGARLSSGFGNRKHPILGYTKMHKGVDFSAPKGTPIMAAGDGVVERCSPYGAYGNYICVRHNGNTKTAYAHMSRYAKGMKAGSKVRQGQVIGYVGATGRATGPHLHFELIQNGKQINPNKITQMPNAKLTGSTLNAFKATIAKYESLRKEKQTAVVAQPPVEIIKNTDVTDILLKAQRKAAMQKKSSVLSPQKGQLPSLTPVYNLVK